MGIGIDGDIDRIVNHYFVFGENPQTGMVDVADADDDRICNVTRADAEKLIRDRNRVIEITKRFAIALARVDKDAFDAIYYPLLAQRRNNG